MKLLISEVLQKVSNAKTKAEKINLSDNENNQLFVENGFLNISYIKTLYKFKTFTKKKYVIISYLQLCIDDKKYYLLRIMSLYIF